MVKDGKINKLQAQDKKTTKEKPVQSSTGKEANGKDKKPIKAGRNAKGQFVKGAAKPANSGRKPGVTNKYGNIRDRLKDIIMPYITDDPDVKKSLSADLMAIDDPVDRIDAVAKLMPFIVPKYSSTTISADNSRPMAEEDRLLELDKQYKKTQTEINIKTLTVFDYDKGEAPQPITNDELLQQLSQPGVNVDDDTDDD
jgi:hypothetical protein